MEDNIQTILIIIVSAFLLFIFPVYMAYEKKDDISYALAMRYTQDLVNEVRSKGYLSRNMYEDYRARLKVTGNSYDIELTHTYNRNDPITNYYTIDKDTNTYVLTKSTTQEERQEEIIKAQEEGKLGGQPTTEELSNYDKEQGFDKVEDTYKLSKEVYGTNHILNVLKTEKKLKVNAAEDVVRCNDDAKDQENQEECQFAYTMNVDDNFNITIKNTNVTLATVIYNMVTVSLSDTNTRIYVNYGGAISSTKWFGKIDLSRADHDKIRIAGSSQLFEILKELHFPESGKQDITEKYTEDYAVEFEAKPEATTELKDVGPVNLADYSGYNFIIGNNGVNNKTDGMSISVGINGISVLSNATTSSNASATSFLFPDIRVGVNKTKTETVKVDSTCTDEGGNEYSCKLDKEITTDYIEYHDEHTYATSYSNVKLQKDDNKIIVILVDNEGKQIEGQMTINSGEKNLFNSFTSFETNLGTDFDYSKGTYIVPVGINKNKRSSLYYTVTIGQSEISLSMTQTVSNENVLLTYPTDIKEYTRIRLEVRKGLVTLFLDDMKVLDGVRINNNTTNPSINVIGQATIGNELYKYNGYIKNLRIYKLMSN